MKYLRNPDEELRSLQRTAQATGDPEDLDRYGQAYRRWITSWTYLVIGPNVWGRGPDLEEAVKQARIGLTNKRSKKTPWTIYRSESPKIWIDDYGSINYQEEVAVDRFKSPSGSAVIRGLRPDLVGDWEVRSQPGVNRFPGDPFPEIEER